MTGLDNAIISDIGGTTTDVAVLDDGRPRLDPNGATVGGFRTMVEAVAMRTFGLGGDSEVSLDDNAMTPGIKLGPRRLVPLALLAANHGSMVIEHLARQVKAVNAGRLDGRFALRTGVPVQMASGLSKGEAELYERMTTEPQPLDRLLASVSADGCNNTAGLSRIGSSCGVHALGCLSCFGSSEQLECRSSAVWCYSLCKAQGWGGSSFLRYAGRGFAPNL